MLPLLKGIILGFSIAAPVGPIGVLCIRRTIALGRLHGFLSGLGAATADAIYGFIAGFGFTFLMNFLLDQRLLLQAAGGVFLCYLGVQTFRSNPAADPAQVKSGSLLGSYLSTLMLTIANPLTMMAFVGIFAGLGIGSSPGDSYAAVSLVTGVFLGSAAWWIVLSVSVGLLRSRLEASSLKWINRVSGLIIAGFGIAALMGLLAS
ncbi:LysE/ArgO family amino acid transporter [Brevibacillus massiliensis]|jgi:threonine/homoserine/homoserine lactone efflux protein|uniref:LysE/ArgO family amino acid transporter n=1 Tax=Brevibacillus massiliensis TaxID=1118054 RepID=UPI0002F8400F|nr:LysE family transporter [Brevibacillus massiliensis]